MFIEEITPHQNSSITLGTGQTLTVPDELWRRTRPGWPDGRAGDQQALEAEPWLPDAAEPLRSADQLQEGDHFEQVKLSQWNNRCWRWRWHRRAAANLALCPINLFPLKKAVWIGLEGLRKPLTCSLSTVQSLLAVLLHNSTYPSGLTSHSRVM